MELKQLSREEVEERLRSCSNKQLLSFAAEQGLRLPTGLSSRAAILDAVHQALGAATKASAPASGAAPVAPQVDPQTPEAGQRSDEPTIMVINTTKRAQYWRFGHKFTNEWEDIPISTFDEPTWRKIRFEEKNLKSRGYPLGFAEKA